MKNTLFLTIIKWLFIIILPCFFTSCNNDVLSKKKMKNIMTEMHIADAIAEQQRTDETALIKTGIIDSVSRYGHIFEKHGTTMEEFRESLIHYVKYPEKMNSISTGVKKQLASMQEEYTKRFEQEELKRNHWPDSVNFFIDTSLNKLKHFSILLKNEGTYELTADIKITVDQAFNSPQLKTYLYHESNGLTPPELTFITANIPSKRASNLIKDTVAEVKKDSSLYRRIIPNYFSTENVIVDSLLEKLLPAQALLCIEPSWHLKFADTISQSQRFTLTTDGQFHNYKIQLTVNKSGKYTLKGTWIDTKQFPKESIPPYQMQVNNVFLRFIPNEKK